MKKILIALASSLLLIGCNEYGADKGVVCCIKAYSTATYKVTIRTQTGNCYDELSFMTNERYTIGDTVVLLNKKTLRNE